MLDTRKETARTMRDNAKPVRIEMDEATARHIRQQNARRFAEFAKAVNTKGLWDA